MRRVGRVPRWAGVVAIAVTVIVVAALAGDVSSGSGRSDHLSRQLRASRTEVKALSDRVRALEGRAASQPDVAAVAKNVAAAVFTIEDSEGGIGSGFAIRFVAPNTEIVTNFHVVEDDWKRNRKELKLRQPGQEFVGRVVNVDPATDLAVIHIDKRVPLLERASGTPAVGDPVIVVGSPMRLDNTVSTGIVSALRDEFLQFSAPVSPGNSGGPVVDRSGRVVAVTRAKEAGGGAEGLSFAIPIAVVCASMGVC